MKCAFCKKKLDGDYYIFTLQNTESKAFQALNVCCQCASRIAYACGQQPESSSAQFHRENTHDGLKYKPLRAFVKPQVDGLF